MTVEAVVRGTAALHCQIVRIEEGGPIDRLIIEYMQNQRIYAGRKKICRAQAIRELLQSCIERKKKTHAEPEQLGLFAGLAPAVGRAKR